MERTGRALLWTRYFLCGAFIGAGAILPGVSGGVMAVVFGVYRPFMELLTRPKAALPRYWRMFLPLSLGWCAGFWGFARGIAAAFHISNTLTTSLLIGLIAGTIPSLYREAGKEGRPASAWTGLILCAAALSALLRYVTHVLRFTAEPNLLWMAFCGVLWGVGIVVPGFSASPIMMALGLYQPLLEGMSRLNLPLFAVSLPAMGLTALLLARGITWLFQTRYAMVSHGILGIVLASTAAIVPTGYAGAGEAAVSGLLCTAGFLLAFLLERLDRKRPAVAP